MTADDKGRPGAGKGGKDIEDLKARLGLNKSPAAKPGAPTASASSEQKKSDAVVDEFSFSLSSKKPELEGKEFSDKELAEIDEQVERAAKPLGRRILTGVILLLAGVILLWLGFQYGSSMSKRIFHNERVAQAQKIQGFVQEEFQNAQGTSLPSRKEITETFIADTDAFAEENFGKYQMWLEALGEGRLPPEFDFEKFKDEDLKVLMKLCSDYLHNVDSYDASEILSGQLYATELGSEVLNFAVKGNRLRWSVDALQYSAQMLETFTFTPNSLDVGATQFFLFAGKPETDKDKDAIAAYFVEKIGPQIPRVEPEFQDVYEAVAFEVPYDCLDENGRPSECKLKIEKFNEKDLLIKSDKQQQINHPYKTQKVRFIEQDVEKEVKVEDLFIIDISSKIEPIRDRVIADKEMELKNFAILLGTMVQGMADVKKYGDELRFEALLDILNQVAGEETYFTF